MNLPNQLTLSRLLLSFVFMAIVHIPSLVAKVAALVVFGVASITDMLDGWLARRRNEISDFGKLLDPIADKVLVLAGFLSFVQLQLIDAWMVVVIIVREFLITSLRLLALSRGKVLEAKVLGKHKTISQMVTIFFILIVLVVRDIGYIQGFWSARIEMVVSSGILGLMLVTVVLTVVSGCSYVWYNRTLIRSL